MGLEGLLIFIVIGVVAGWIAGQVMKGGGFGLVGDLLVGVAGAFVGGLIFPRIGLSFGGGIIGDIISAALGAIILLFVIRLIKRA
jgi:uncharacterized membrane protein YeaQ/YmgE (transglycosylase-associated protein family)